MSGTEPGSPAHHALACALGGMMSGEGARLIGSECRDWASGPLCGERHDFAFAFADAVPPPRAVALARRIGRTEFRIERGFVADTELSISPGCASLIRIAALTIDA